MEVKEADLPKRRQERKKPKERKRRKDNGQEETANSHKTE